MSRLLALLYGISFFPIFFATFPSAIGFVGDRVVPKAIESNPTDSFGKSCQDDPA